MNRSRSRSPKKLTGFARRRAEKGFGDKPSGFSREPRSTGFSEKPMEAPTSQQKMTTAEILDHYKQYNPNQNLTNHNKAERQLYVGNIP